MDKRSETKGCIFRLLIATAAVVFVSGNFLAQADTLGTGVEAPKATTLVSKQSQEKASTVLVSKEAEKPPVKMIRKSMFGEVSAKDPNGIAVVYAKNKEERSSKEMWFPFESDLKLERYKSVADIQEGDKVKVTYEEAEDGSKRVLAGIALQKKAPKEEELPADEEGSDE